MSTAPGKHTAPKDPFGPLSAILSGLVLGFFAVLFMPDGLKRALQTFAQSAATAPAVKGNGEPAAPSPLTPATDANASGKTGAKDDNAQNAPVPASQEAGSKPVAPQLIPALDIQFPKPFSREDMNAALEPVLSFKLSEDDAKAVKEAFEAASREDGGGVLAAIRKMNAPAAKTFAEWKRLRQHDADFDEVMAFRAAHPLFPEPPQDSAAEKKLLLSNVPAASVLKYYTNRVPLSGAGHASLGGALIETGERERGIKLIKYAWHRFALDPAVEDQIRARFGSILEPADQAKRAQMIAIRAAAKEDKTASETSKRGLRGVAKLRGRTGKGKGRNRIARRRGRSADAGPRIQEEAGAGIRLQVQPLAKFVRLKKAKQASKKEEEKTPKTAQEKAAENAFGLSKERAGGPATLLARLKALRREGDSHDLWALLRSIDPASADLADPERWWDFRRSEIRRALSEDMPKTAYAIAKAHGPMEGENGSDAEFLAGWIALRFLKDPQKAIPHFERSRVPEFVRTQARGSYWLGRAEFELGLGKDAQASFAEASKWYFTLYGGLAYEALHKASGCEFRAPPRPSKEAIAAFVNEDAFKAIVIAKQAGLDAVLNAFILDLARQLGDPQQMTLLMEVAERIAPPHVAVHAAKIALLRGFAADAYAYPALLPKFAEPGGNAKLETALLHALTRQESEFYTGTVSTAGARGLMQLMPQTAKLTAASVKMKYEMGRLIFDPSYNVTLGAAFLAQLLSGYNGSYVLALAAYNAGPGRVSEWIGDLGDPRDKSTDAIDWIERIPFNETRNYVQRILESVQLYRCRFESGNTRFQILEDLHRGRPGKLPDFTSVEGSADLDETK
jgi:soluble lytic murein transglycosylase